MRLTYRECALWGTVGADARIRPRGVGDAAPCKYGKQTLVGNVRAGHARPLQGNEYSGEEVRIHDGSDF